MKIVSHSGALWFVLMMLAFAIKKLFYFLRSHWLSAVLLLWYWHSVQGTLSCVNEFKMPPHFLFFQTQDIWTAWDYIKVLGKFATEFFHVDKNYSICILQHANLPRTLTSKWFRYAESDKTENMEALSTIIEDAVFLYCIFLASLAKIKCP